MVFGLIVASIAGGVIGRRWLPEEHLSGDSKDVIRLATALIGTMSALVLALLFTSTRTSYEATNASVGRMTTSIIELDNALKKYGPEGQALRAALREDVLAIVASVWQDDADARRQEQSSKSATQEVTVMAMLSAMAPTTPQQAAVQSRAIVVSNEVEHIRLTLLAQPTDSLSRPFVTVLVLWLMFIFATFSMSAKANATVVTVLLVCALAASVAIYLIIELGQPFDGLMQIPSAELRNALAPLPKP